MNNYSHILSKKQLVYLNKNNLTIINKEEIEKFKFIKYKQIINILIDKICEIVFSKFKSKIKIYCRSEIENVEKIIKEDIEIIIENFMEVVYSYKPEYKCWSGKNLRENTIKAIKRYKIFEIFEEKNNKLIFVDCNLFMNNKKVQKFINDLSEKRKESKFVIKERKII